jgi:hypothetical protein
LPELPKIELSDINGYLEFSYASFMIHAGDHGPTQQPIDALSPAVSPVVLDRWNLEVGRHDATARIDLKWQESAAMSDFVSAGCQDNVYSTEHTRDGGGAELLSHWAGQSAGLQ